MVKKPGDRGYAVEEGNRRYANFKSRNMTQIEGTVNLRDIQQAFIKEAAAEARGEEYRHPWSAQAYSDDLGIDVDYESEKSYDELLGETEEHFVTEFKKMIKEVIDDAKVSNEFEAMARKYGEEDSFSIDALVTIKTLGELADWCDQATHLHLFYFRKTHGRQRKRESDEMQVFQDLFGEALGVIIQGITEKRLDLQARGRDMF